MTKKPHIIHVLDDLSDPVRRQYIEELTRQTSMYWHSVLIRKEKSIAASPLLKMQPWPPQLPILYLTNAAERFFWSTCEVDVVIWHAEEYQLKEIRTGITAKATWIKTVYEGVFLQGTGFDYTVETRVVAVPPGSRNVRYIPISYIKRWIALLEQTHAVQSIPLGSTQGSELTEHATGSSFLALSWALSGNRGSNTTATAEDRDPGGEQCSGTSPTKLLDNTGLADKSRGQALVPKSPLPGPPRAEGFQIQQLQPSDRAGVADMQLPEHAVLSPRSQLYDPELTRGSQDDRMVAQHFLCRDPTSVPSGISTHIFGGGRPQDRKLQQTIQSRSVPESGSSNTQPNSVQSDNPKDGRTTFTFSRERSENSQDKQALSSPYIPVSSTPHSGRSGNQRVICHWLRHCQIGGTEFYCYNLIKSLPDYTHYVVIRNHQYDESMLELLRTVATRVVYLAVGEFIRQEHLSSTCDIVIDHTSMRYTTEPSKLTNPEKYWIKVCHAPEVRKSHEPYDHYVAVTTKARYFQSNTSFPICHGCVDTSLYTTTRGVSSHCIIGRYGSDRPQKFDYHLGEILKPLVRADTSLLMVGGGEFLKSEFTRHGLTNFTNLLPASLLGKHIYLRAMDTAIYRNAMDFIEGFSLSIVELMASGVVVVAEDRGGNQEQISDGADGFLVPWDRPDLFTQKLKWLRDNPLQRLQMSEQAAAKARKLWDIKNMRDEWLAVLEPAWSGGVLNLGNKPNRSTNGVANGDGY